MGHASGLVDGDAFQWYQSQDIADLRRAVDAIGGVSLLLIAPIVLAVAGDMNRANDVRRSLQAVVDFAEAHGYAVIVSRTLPRAALARRHRIGLLAPMHSAPWRVWYW
ncbi:AAA family ATPase [Janthinobacterium violaceinigrum]|uniref:Uncharacterized protein n=1 Tax=Janthinobacterium violaceinigrum TaxID=2654252 RepID=A0A6I1IAX5_9BURK|nr:AAA family ATPase [Janthinobacterium violaceinigrum]KAB8065516.1 hypothetical protein GCN75_06955 [Janthinobacterium violaceinigrum]